MRNRAPGVIRVAFVMALSASAVVSAGAAFGARLPSRFVPGDAVVSPASADQSAPFLAQGGSTVLAVWSDNRANSTGGYEGETSRDIYGMRLDGLGNPLDAVPFAIAAGPASQEIPRAAWNGVNWLVVYESYDVSGTGYYYQKSLEAVRVAPDGRVLDGKPIKIYNDTPVGATWAVASDGSNWVVVNQGTSATGDIVASRISSAGVLLDPGPRSLVAGTYYLRGGFHLAYAAGVFLLAYEESMTGSDPTNAIRFDSTLNVLDSAPFGLAGVPLSRLISNGSGFYAVWNEQLPDYTMAVKGSRIGTSGQKLDGAGVNISGTNQPQAYTTTSVAWDGSTWKVTWGAASGTRIARVSASGQVLDPGGVAVAGPQTGLTASAGSGSVQLVWAAQASNSVNDVYSASISSNNTPGPNRTLSVGAPAQMQPDIAAGGLGYMLVYRSLATNLHRILAQPLDAAGAPLTSEPIEVAAGDWRSIPGPASVAWNGSVFMVTWGSSNGVHARRLRGDGTPLDPAPILVMSPAFGPADVEALGENFLVVGLRCGYTCQYIFPIAARVRGSDGVVLDSTPISINGIYSSSPRVTTLEGRWLVAFQDNVSHDDTMASTDAVFIDANGVKGSEFMVHGYYSTGGGNGIFSLGLAASGKVAMMVQSQELTSGVENDVLARVIHPDGTVDPYVNLTPWSGNQHRPRVAYDGSQFVVVFQDQKARFAEQGLEQLDARSDLFGMRVSSTGGIIDPQGFVFSNSASGEAYPNVATLNGATLIAGSIVRNESPYANYRLGYELFGVGGNAWPVASAAATPTGGDVPLTVGFSSTGSRDQDGTVASYAWSFGDGAVSPDPNPAHTYTVAGPYVATLTVTDNGGAQTMQEVPVKALAPNVPPVAVASSNRNSGPAPLDVTFYANGSYDPDGFIGNIQWTFSDGGEYWGATAYHTFYQEGTWQATVTVFDARGGTGTDSLTITVGQPLPPAAPGNLVATTFTTDWINLTWTDNSNSEDGFKVERCTGSASYCAANPAQFVQVAQTGANIDYYGDTGLPPGTTYTYRVRAFNGTGDSAYSNSSTATTLTLGPAAPSNLTARSGSSGSGKSRVNYIDLSWTDNSTNETNFILERCAGSTCTNFTVRATLGANITTYRDNNLPRRATFRYRVKARNSNGDSGYSNIAAATTP